MVIRFKEMFVSKDDFGNLKASLAELLLIVKDNTTLVKFLMFLAKTFEIFVFLEHSSGNWTRSHITFN